MSRSLLQNLYLFKSMTADELNTISSVVESQHYTRGDTIFIRGEKATALYLIKSGSIKIQQSTSSGDNIDVATLSAGSHFGEMAFIDGELRSATAVAHEPCELLVVSYEKLNALLAKNLPIAVKLYKEFAHFLCGRLRATTHDLSSYREKNLTHF